MHKLVDLSEGGVSNHSSSDPSSDPSSIRPILAL